MELIIVTTTKKTVIDTRDSTKVNPDFWENNFLGILRVRI